VYVLSCIHTIPPVVQPSIQPVLTCKQGVITHLTEIRRKYFGKAILVYFTVGVCNAAFRTRPTYTVAIICVKNIGDIGCMQLHVSVQHGPGEHGHHTFFIFITNTDKRLSYRRETCATFCLSWNIGLLLCEQRNQIACQPKEHFLQLPRFIPHSFLHAS